METKAIARGDAGLVLVLGLGAGVIVAAVTFLVSRWQLDVGGSGIMMVTIPAPAALLLAVSLFVAYRRASFTAGLLVGLVGLVVTAFAVFAVVALEGLVWMEQRGVYILDGDPPRQAVAAHEVTVNILSSGLWWGHLVMWVPAVLLGAAVGAWIGRSGAPQNRVSEAK